MDTAEEMDSLYSKIEDPFEYRKINRYPILLGLMEQFGVEGKTLEVACSEGILAGMLPERFKTDYLGMDVSSVAVSRAREKYKGDDRMRWLVADATKHDFMLKFDMIVISDVYMYMNDIKHFHRKTVGLLNPGGILLATSYSSSYCGSEMFPALEFQDNMETLFVGKSLTRSNKDDYESDYYVGKKR